MAWGTILVWMAVAAGLALVVWYDRRKLPRARSDWGVWPDDERNIPLVARYARCRETAADESALDDRTWADLNLDDVFRVFDRAETLVGQQVLYGRLRHPGRSTDLAAFESLCATFERDATARAAAGLALRRMRRVDAADLWWLTRPGSFTSEPWHIVFPIIATAMVCLAIAMSVYPVALLGLAAGTIVAVVLRVSAAAHLRIAGDAFRQVEPVLTAATALRAITNPAGNRSITAPLGADLDSLGPLRRIAKWAGRDPSGAASGELSSVVFEYLNFALSLDGNAVYFGARQLRAHGEALARVVHAVGEVDAALSVAAYRSAVPGWCRPTFVADGAVHLGGLRHPLLPDAVPATIDLAPPHGVIVTGSNMSGKTTFLRALGVNAVLAQTINTCTAERYEAPRLVIRSCIGRADDPASGKSYYLVEVEAVLSLVAASQDPAPHLFLFDELFRGTNTIERIAAGEAVLAALLGRTPGGAPSPHIVIAATHDQELVELLQGQYAPYHFSDRVGEAGLAFDYELRPGPARTRNAIALLQLRGASADLIARATARANALDRLHDSAP